MKSTYVYGPELREFTPAERERIRVLIASAAVSRGFLHDARAALERIHRDAGRVRPFLLWDIWNLDGRPPVWAFSEEVGDWPRDWWTLPEYRRIRREAEERGVP
ncbi:hypothetical protein OG563_06015 [Nocardia vinacea]|uniref:Uncharacterized protein n=1 Tax=Nocardia vinacea TaxID=96468 RepID=A0ABZ1YZY3_9NOCA|nr:hypothetical protein [Nocardia vinacea]